MSALPPKADIGWIAAMLALRGRFIDGDVTQIAQLAMTGLAQAADSAALGTPLLPEMLRAALLLPRRNGNLIALLLPGGQRLIDSAVAVFAS